MMHNPLVKLNCLFSQCSDSTTFFLFISYVSLNMTDIYYGKFTVQLQYDMNVILAFQTVKSKQLHSLYQLVFACSTLVR